MDLSFLIDTNVAIQIEETGQEGQIREMFARLHAEVLKWQIPTFCHPRSEEELQNDKDEVRKREMLSRLRKYPRLQSPPEAEGPELEKLFGGISKSNDRVDCQILYALYRNCVAYLVTEDNGIHRRARNSGLSERVLSVAEAVDIIKRAFERSSVQLPLVQEEFTYNIDIGDSLFTSLKADYSGFEKWYQEKCCAKQRKAWTIRSNGHLAGVCIYKHDDEEELKGIGFPSIKLCTFKVSDDFRGAKFGELLLKSAFQYAVANNIKSVWVTAHEKQVILIQFLKDFGFQVHKDLSGTDMVFYKHMLPPADVPAMNALDFYVRYSPCCLDGSEIGKFAVPIRPVYHDLLFPEISPQLSLGTGVPGNTIKKVYLSQSNVRDIPTGSLLFFYRSAPQQELTSIGIVERARRLSDIEAIASAIGKRSVYTMEEVASMLKDGRDILVINFRIVRHFRTSVPLRVLVDERVFNRRPPQSIAAVEHDAYLRLKPLLA